MSLYYLSHGEFPGEKAHTIQMAKMCAGFAANGVSTTLVHPSYGQGEVSFDELAAFYDLDHEFRVRTLPSFSGKNPIPNVPTTGEIVTFFWLVSQYLRGRITSDDILYSRYLVPTFAFLHVVDAIPRRERPTIVFEQHHTKTEHPFISEQLYRRLDGIVCIADQLAERLSSQFDIPAEKLFVAHDGVSLERYEGITQQSARERLGLPSDRDIVMYTGHLYEDKNVEQFIRAATDIEADVCVVGGYEEDIERLKRTVAESNSVTFTGFVEPNDIPVYQRAADVLVATAAQDAEYYSPLKLFEYMAAGKPIVATRTEAFEEVLTHEQNCLFVDSSAPSAMSEQIARLLDDDELCTRIGETNEMEVQTYGWQNRAERILEFV